MSQTHTVDYTQSCTPLYLCLRCLLPPLLFTTLLLRRQGRRLNKRVRSFELVQMLAYLKLTNAPKCCFTERCGDRVWPRHWPCEVVWDAQASAAWEGLVLPGLQRFVEQLLLLTSSETEQDRLLQDMV